MTDRREPMPARDLVDPLFDGHLDRDLLSLSVEERLGWIWTAMTLLRASRLRADGADEQE